MARQCSVSMPDGRTCRAGPQRDRPFCFAHDPERRADAAAARTLGGQRRKRERTITLAYDLPGLDSVAGIRRLLDIVVADGLGLQNGIAKLRILIAVAGSATRLLETHELADRLAALEAVVGADDRSS